MDSLKNAMGMNDSSSSSSENPPLEGQATEQKQGGGGFLSGLGDKVNSAAGGGRESEKNEDLLDKGSCLEHDFPSSLIFLMLNWGQIPRV